MSEASKPLFYEQLEVYEQLEELKEREFPTKYDAGVVSKCGEHFFVAYSQYGAEQTFSIGQPVYDNDGNIMGWLGVALYENLNYSVTAIRVPVEHWQICLPTKHCQNGKNVFTYWQQREHEGVIEDD